MRNFHHYFIATLMNKNIKRLLVVFGIAVVAIVSFQAVQPRPLQIKEGTRIALVGGNLGSRMINYDHFETEMQLRYPNNALYVRNLCDGGDTPGFRPHSARFTPWAFPGAEKFQTEYASNSGSEGHLETHDQWLTRLKTDVVIGFLGTASRFKARRGWPTTKPN